ncbi:MAG TPA: vWA domain-containing protein [Polyangiaceae bacterium]|nr:vWA domain-containing protein [Polyangiaceae bacterium]
MKNDTQLGIRFAAITAFIAGMACSSHDGAAFGSNGSGGVTGAGIVVGGQNAGSGAPSSGGAAAGETSPPSASTGLFTVAPVQSSPCSNADISVLFVIDRSGSMNCNLPPITASADCEALSPPAKVDVTQPSKWEVITQTLSQSLGELAMQDGAAHVRVGLAYFSVDGVCGASSTPAVPVDVATRAQLDLMSQSLAKQKPNGGTPIVGATVLAYKELYQTLAVSGNAHVILITDGKDSCADYYAAQPSIGPGDQVARLITGEAPAALDVGIKTWVIGAPGSEIARSTLSNLAIAGGTRRSDDCVPGSATDPTVGDCHYDMTTGDFQATLTTALQHILKVVTCQVVR